MKTLTKSIEATTLFNSIVKGKNIMTPDIIGHYKIKNGAVEFSHGSGFMGGEMFGVTIVRGGKMIHDENKCFDDRAEAEQYILSLN